VGVYKTAVSKKEVARVAVLKKMVSREAVTRKEYPEWQ
jgi:hypothetical protein